MYSGAWGRVDAHRPPRSPLNISAAFHCRGERQRLQSKGFELAVAGFVAPAAVEGLKPLNLEVVAWTRLPYLSSGTTTISHMFLDSALFVLRLTHTV